MAEPTEPSEITRRAYAAYFVGRAQPADKRPQPNVLVEPNVVVDHDGLRYAVIRDTGGAALAVFRVRNDGMLRRMKRPPAAVVAA